jgi:regulator of protease activity HflC (stomatin/prohibitin superfamily)
MDYSAPLQTVSPVFGTLGLLALGLAIVTVWQMVRIVDAYDKEALTVFGEYRGLLEPGINFVPPFVSRTFRFDMRTQTMDVPRQEAITRDNSPVTADAVVYLRVMDAKKAFLEVDDYKTAVSNLAQTTLRAVIGDMELDDTLNKRQEINARIRRELDEPTDEWGIRVESVEVREVNPSQEVQNAMEQQTGAERRRRATILEAQGDSISTVLRANSAESMGERAIIDKGMETLGEIGQSPSTTFVLPQELTSLVGRYGKHLTGSDVASNGHQLDSQSFDAETRELIGLDDIKEILGEIDSAAELDVAELEQQARAVKEGEENPKTADTDGGVDGDDPETAPEE